MEKEQKNFLFFMLGLLAFAWLYVIVSWEDVGSVLSIPLAFYTLNSISDIKYCCGLIPGDSNKEIEERQKEKERQQKEHQAYVNSLTKEQQLELYYEFGPCWEDWVEWYLFG